MRKKLSLLLAMSLSAIMLLAGCGSSRSSKKMQQQSKR